MLKFREIWASVLQKNEIKNLAPRSLPSGYTTAGSGGALAYTQA